MFISCAVALFAMTALNANAADQSQSENGSCKAQTECVGKSCDKADKACKGKGKKGKKGKKGGKDCCKGKQGRQIAQCCKGKKGNPAFAGIELTADQQAKIMDINNKREAAVKKSREELNKAIAKDREQYNAEIRKVLTAEQQVTYDKNIAEMKARRAEKAALRQAKADYKKVKAEIKKDKKRVDRIGNDVKTDFKR